MYPYENSGYSEIIAILVSVVQPFLGSAVVFLCKGHKIGLLVTLFMYAICRLGIWWCSSFKSFGSLVTVLRSVILHWTWYNESRDSGDVLTGYIVIQFCNVRGLYMGRIPYSYGCDLFSILYSTRLLHQKWIIAKLGLQWDFFFLWYLMETWVPVLCMGVMFFLCWWLNELWLYAWWWADGNLSFHFLPHCCLCSNSGFCASLGKGKMHGFMQIFLHD